MTLLRLGIRVRADRAEVALAQLLPILHGGVEERALDGVVEYALYSAEHELPAVEEVRALAGDALLEVRAEPVDDGWDVRWHEHLRAVRARDLVVRPPWIDGSRDDLVIDPGTLFGAGTGVLAIAAARLGWEPVTAVDLDPAALDVIRANAARNGVEVEAIAGDVRVGAPWAPTVVANLPKPVLLDAARPDRGVVDLPERIIAAGMLAKDAGEVAAAFAPLRERRRLEDDGWAALVLA